MCKIYIYIRVYIVRHGGLLKLIIEGSVEEKDHRGEPRLEYIQQLIRDQGRGFIRTNEKESG